MGVLVVSMRASKLSLNSTDNNKELYTTEVYEIKSNNFVQLVAEPYWDIYLVIGFQMV